MLKSTFSRRPSVAVVVPHSRCTLPEATASIRVAGVSATHSVLSDDTPAALANVGNEKHVPLVLEARQLAWAYSVPGFQDFNAFEYTIYNRSGHTLDSMFFGFRVDMDCGPVVASAYWNDDQDVPTFPSGHFSLPVLADDPRYPQKFSFLGIRMGVNFVIYTMTH